VHQRLAPLPSGIRGHFGPELRRFVLMQHHQGQVTVAGLEAADWVSVDDTGARHRGANAVCTQVGNDDFAWFGTTGSKSRPSLHSLVRTPRWHGGAMARASPARFDILAVFPDRLD